MKERFVLPILALLMFVATVWLGNVSSRAEAAGRLLVPPPEGIEHAQFGFKESVADSLWIRWIQDIDTCYTFVEGNQPALVQKPAGGDILTQVPRHKNCDNSWAFKMLDAVTKLDPQFEMPYMWGAPVLSVLIEDYEGASAIFNRGVEAYPRNWEIAYRAAYHFQFDRQDFKRAADLLNQAADNGAPTWVRSLASRLYSRAGQLELGLSTLRAYRQTFTDEKQAEVIDKRIRALEEELKKDNGN